MYFYVHSFGYKYVGPFEYLGGLRNKRILYLISPELMLPWEMRGKQKAAGTGLDTQRSAEEWLPKDHPTLRD